MNKLIKGIFLLIFGFSIQWLLIFLFNYETGIELGIIFSFGLSILFSIIVCIIFFNANRWKYQFLKRRLFIKLLFLLLIVNYLIWPKGDINPFQEISNSIKVLNNYSSIKYSDLYSNCENDNNALVTAALYKFKKSLPQDAFLVKTFNCSQGHDCLHSYYVELRNGHLNSNNPNLRIENPVTDRFYQFTEIFKSDTIVYKRNFDILNFASEKVSKTFCNEYRIEKFKIANGYNKCFYKLLEIIE